MGGVDILGPRAEMLGKGEKARMFARAIVMRLTGRAIGAQHRVALGLAHGDLNATAEIIVTEPEIGEPALHPLDMDRRAGMRGTAQRQPLG